MEIKIKAKSAVIYDEIEIDKRDPQVRETNSPNVDTPCLGRVIVGGGLQPFQPRRKMEIFSKTKTNRLKIVQYPNHSECFVTAGERHISHAKAFS